MWKKKGPRERRSIHIIFFFLLLFSPPRRRRRRNTLLPRVRVALHRVSKQVGWIINTKKNWYYFRRTVRVCVCVYHRPGLRGTVAQTFGPYNDRVHHHHHHRRRYHAAVRCSILFFFFFYIITVLDRRRVVAEEVCAAILCEGLGRRRRGRSVSHSRLPPARTNPGELLTATAPARNNNLQ